MSGTATKGIGEVDLWGLGRPVKGADIQRAGSYLPTVISNVL